ncbi:MAG TPA: putative toxin-antitoxin system toxin component, PIN family [Thermoanaerobaculia bacterium]|nr:putative toxin-antitoxin system toxin component, PIN family [Thermoanaerobaculia bacterium]
MLSIDGTIRGTMTISRAVLDTNVIVSAFRSRRGPAYRLVSEISRRNFEISVSVPLVLEYEEVLQRATGLGEQEVLDVLRFLCSVAKRQEIFFLWRPILPDPKDDMVLEVAVASRAGHIVTYNGKDFGAAAGFGIGVLTPESFLRIIGV